MVPWHDINFGAQCTENLATHMKSGLSGVEARQRMHCAKEPDGEEAGMKKYEVLWWESLADELGFETENNLNKQ